MDPSESFVIRPITAADTISIRHAVLWPNSPREYVYLPEDDVGLHFGAFVSGQAEPIAVISLFNEAMPAIDGALQGDHTDTALQDSPTTIFRFRKFACNQTYQGRGVGSALLQHVVSYARGQLGARAVWCEARQSVADWYKKRGLLPFGEPFYKGGLEYIRMRTEFI